MEAQGVQSMEPVQAWYATLTDLFGTKNATTNYGFLYIAQGVGSILGGPVAAYIREATGNWNVVFAIVVGLDVVTALLAMFVLKSMRRRWVSASLNPA